MPAPAPSPAVLDFLTARRSARPAMLRAPGPTPDERDRILQAAARVPDHKKLVPWRFIVFEGAARATFGEALAEALLAEDGDAPSNVRLQTERERFLRAPLVIGVVSSPVDGRGVPASEQLLSCGAACFNLCLAANALGYQSAWISEWYSYSPAVHAHLGLASHEAMAGFIYIGSADDRQPDRDRPDLAAITTHYPATPCA